MSTNTNRQTIENKLLGVNRTEMNVHCVQRKPDSSKYNYHKYKPMTDWTINHFTEGFPFQPSDLLIQIIVKHHVILHSEICTQSPGKKGWYENRSLKTQRRFQKQWKGIQRGSFVPADPALLITLCSLLNTQDQANIIEGLIPRSHIKQEIVLAVVSGRKEIMKKLWVWWLHALSLIGHWDYGNYCVYTSVKSSSCLSFFIIMVLKV